MDSSNTDLIVRANNVLYCQGRLQDVDTYFTDDYVAHLCDKNLTMGHNGVNHIVAYYRKAFSGIDVKVEILVENDDRIAWRRLFHATHTSAFKGFPPSNKNILWCDMVVSRICNAKIAEEWITSDLAEQLLAARKS